MPITKIVTEPVAEPITIAEAATHCRIDFPTTEAEYLQSLILVARRYVENATNRALIDRTIDWYFDWFPNKSYRWDYPYTQQPICVPYAPLVSVTSIKYTDTNSVQQTWDSSYYTVDTDSDEGRIYPVYGQYYPTDVQYISNAIVIRYVAGYTITTDSPQDSPLDYADNVPQELKQAMLLVVGHLYENRELSTMDSINTLPFGVKELIGSYRVRRF